MCSHVSFAEELYERNRDIVSAIRAHPLGGRMEAVGEESDVHAYLHQVHLASVEAAPLFTALTIKAPTAVDSAEVHASLRSMFCSMQQAVEHCGVTGNREALPGRPMLPATEELALFLKRLASEEFHVGAAAVVALLRCLWTKPGADTDAPNSASCLVREVVAFRRGVQLGMTVHVMSRLLDGAPSKARGTAASVYRGALERWVTFWDACWEMVRAR